MIRYCICIAAILTGLLVGCARNASSVLDIDAGLYAVQYTPSQIRNVLLQLGYEPVKTYNTVTGQYVTERHSADEIRARYRSNELASVTIVVRVNKVSGLVRLAFREQNTSRHSEQAQIAYRELRESLENIFGSNQVTDCTRGLRCAAF